MVSVIIWAVVKRSDYLKAKPKLDVDVKSCMFVQDQSLNRARVKAGRSQILSYGQQLSQMIKVMSELDLGSESVVSTIYVCCAMRSMGIV